MYPDIEVYSEQYRHVRRAHFEHVAVEYRHRGVDARGEEGTAPPGVWCDPQPPGRGHRGDADGLGDTTRPHQIGLGDVEGVVIEQRPESKRVNSRSPVAIGISVASRTCARPACRRRDRPFVP
jgi:hypothetical protein